MNGEAGKGDAYRPVDLKKYNENYDRIFGKRDGNAKQKETEEKEGTTSNCPTGDHRKSPKWRKN